MTRTNTNPTLTAARRLHERGLWLLPILSSKACFSPGWQNDRLDFAVLEAMLQQDPTIGIGVVWNRSPYLDLDCDDDAAEANLEALCGGPLPRTPTFRSKRGLHRIFTRPAGLPSKASAKLAGVGEVKGLVASPEGVAVKDQGSFSIVPPTGSRFWLPFRDLDDLEAAPLPEAIAVQLRYDHEQQQIRRRLRSAKHGYAPRRSRLPRLWTLLQHVVKSVLGEPLRVKDDGYAVWVCPRCQRPTFYTRRWHPVYKDRWACGNRLCLWFNLPLDELDILEYGSIRDDLIETRGHLYLKLAALREDHRRLCPDGLHPKRYE
jgi:hypothetical protein